MRSLFVMDPLDRIEVETDSTWMLMRETQGRGWPVFACEPRHLAFNGTEVVARARQVTCLDADPWFQVEPVVTLPLADCGLVWMRKDPPFDIDYVFTTYLLDVAHRVTTVVNDPASLKLANEKMYSLNWRELIPETIIGCGVAETRRAVEYMGEAILKPWDGNGGRGVLVARAGDPNLPIMVELLTDEGRRPVVVQRYVPEIRDGDKRIILVEGEPRGWMTRIPQPGDHRGNIHVGARVRSCDLTPRDRQICEALAEDLRSGGMVFVGIDVIGEYLTEINVTSPTGIQEANRLLGVSLEEELVTAAWRRARTRGDRTS